MKVKSLSLLVEHSSTVILNVHKTICLKKKKKNNKK